MALFWHHFRFLLLRELLNRWRDKDNIKINIVVPPLLSVMIGLLLRFSESETYTFSENMNILPFLFMAIIISMFLGLTNSANAILKDRTILLRERLLGVSSLAYYLAKFLTLALFLVIQVFLFIIIAHWLLGIRAMFWYYFSYMYLSALIGCSIGLMISIFARNSVAAYNIVPLILIPQIIFGGALVHFENMNKSFKVNQQRPIPEFCEFIPSRWAVEGLFAAQSFQNLYQLKATERDQFRELWRRCKEDCRSQDDPELCQSNRCAGLKEQYMVLRDEANELIDYSNSSMFTAITLDYREGELQANSDALYYGKFLTEHKVFAGRIVETVNFNYFVLILYIVLINLANCAFLKIKLKRTFIT